MRERFIAGVQGKFRPLGRGLRFVVAFGLFLAAGSMLVAAFVGSPAPEVKKEASVRATTIEGNSTVAQVTTVDAKAVANSSSQPTYISTPVVARTKSGAGNVPQYVQNVPLTVGPITAQAAGCSTVGNVTTCNAANTQLVRDSPGGTSGTGEYMPYSSDIVASGVAGPVTKVTVTLNHLSTDRGDRIFAMLVGPNGNNIVFFGRPCNGFTAAEKAITDKTFTFDDSGTNTFPGAVTNDTAHQCANKTSSPPSYQEIAYDGGTGAMVFPAPAPAPSFATPAGSTTFSGQFTGMTAATANGTWKLYAASQAALPSTGTIGNGSSPSWTLNITFTSATATTTTVSSNLNPSFTTAPNNVVTLTATVSSTSTVNAGTVTFKDGTSTIACSGGNQTVANGSATCQSTFPTEGAHIITAQYSGGGSFAASNSSALNQVVNKHTTAQVSPPAGTVGFCNTGPITIPQSGANGDPTGTPASPYASEIFVSGQSGIINGIQVYLTGFTSSEPFAEGFLLVSPTGKTLDFLSQAGGGMPFSNFNFIISDSGATQMPDASAPTNNTTYKPSSYTNSPTTYCQAAVCNGVTVSEAAPSPFDSAAPRGSKTLLGQFGGLGANGTWQLFAVNRQSLQTASVSGGWCINFTLAVGAHPTTTTLVSSLNPSFLGDSVTFTATVVNQDTPSGQINEGTVTFMDGLTNLGTANVTFNSTANVATFTTNNPLVLNEATHPISASYSGTANFGFSSSNTVQQVVNRHSVASVVVNVSGNTYSFCNGGPVTVPAAGAANALQGVARPYPSNIFVANLPGVTNKVTLSLKNYTSNLPSDFASLIVGPGGGPTYAFDFFSRVGGTNCVGDPNCPGGTGFNGDNLTFQDGSGTVPALSSGQTLTVGMNSGPGTNAWPTPAPASFLYATPQGSALLSAFNGQNSLGTWSLYMENLVNGAFGGIGDNVNPSNPTLNAWCVNLTQNPVTVIATKSHTSPILNSHFRQGQQAGAAFTLSITNNGPGPTGDPDNLHPLQVIDTLNAALTPVSLPTGAPWDCTAVGQVVTCNNHNTIAQGSTYPLLTIPVTVANNAPASASNSVTINGAAAAINGGGASTATSNTDAVIIDPAAVLAITKAHTGTFTQGSTATWTLQVANNSATAAGTTDGSTATVTDILPAGYTLASATGTNWSCSGAGTQTATCTSSAVVAGAGGLFPLITLTVNVPANSPVSVSNSAKVYGGGDLIHTSAGTAAVSNTDSVTVIQVPASITINAGPTQQAIVNQNFGTGLAVTVKDAGNVVIASYSPVVFTATTGGSGQSGTFTFNSSGTRSVTTDASGIGSAGTFTANANTGAYTVGVTAGPAPSATFNLTNVMPPAFTSANTTTFTAGTAGNFNVTASGFPSPTINLTSGSLPSGVNYGTGTLAGTPGLNAYGTYALTFTASNGVGTNATQNFSLVVNPSAQDVKSKPSITANVGGGFHVAFIGNPGTQYTIQFAPTLPVLPAVPNWQTLSLQTANASGVFSVDDNPGTTTRFYRAIIP